MAVLFDGEKEQMTQKTSVNGCYNHVLAFASHSVCFSKNACTIEILLMKFWYAMCATDSAKCNSKEALSPCISLAIVLGLCWYHLSQTDLRMLQRPFTTYHVTLKEENLQVYRKSPLFGFASYKLIHR